MTIGIPVEVGEEPARAGGGLLDRNGPVLVSVKESQEGHSKRRTGRRWSRYNCRIGTLGHPPIPTVLARLTLIGSKHHRVRGSRLNGKTDIRGGSGRNHRRRFGKVESRVAEGYVIDRIELEIVNDHATALKELHLLSRTQRRDEAGNLVEVVTTGHIYEGAEWLLGRDIRDAEFARGHRRQIELENADGRRLRCRNSWQSEQSRAKGGQEVRGGSHF